ncbi:MAG: hypothetical protein KJ047_00005 [Anaerolineae bacterium]|nr:hypothetical protein [Anaerolineae bacterium]
MKKRRNFYQGATLINLVFVLALAVFIISNNGDLSSGCLPLALTAVILPILLAWRCDMRLREERRHEALMKALLAIHRKLGES